MNYLCCLVRCGETSWHATLHCVRYLSRSARCRSTEPDCLVRSHTVWRWNRAGHIQGYTQTEPRSPPQSRCQGASQSAARGWSCTAWSWSVGQLHGLERTFRTALHLNMIRKVIEDFKTVSQHNLRLNKRVHFQFPQPLTSDPSCSHTLSEALGDLKINLIVENWGFKINK